MTTSILSWALILCGGRGERLRPLTDDVPKPMVSVAGRPIIEYQVRWLLSHGISNIVFLTGYKAEVIKDHFRGGTAFGFKAYYSHEDEPLGRGGAIRRAITTTDVKHQEDFVVINGDNLCNDNLLRMYRFHKESNYVATLHLTPYVSQYGIIQVNAGMITEFREKGEMPGFYINSGIYIFNRRIVPMLPLEGDHEDTTFPQQAIQRSLGGYIQTPKTYWYTMDTIADIQRVERILYP